MPKWLFACPVSSNDPEFPVKSRADLDISQPSCNENTNAMDLPRRIGYFELWSQNRPCDKFNPEQIAAGALTHINIAFAGIDDKFSITDTDGGMVARIAHLKKRYVGLRVNIAIGIYKAFALTVYEKLRTI